MQRPKNSSAIDCCTWLSWNQTACATGPLLGLERIRGGATLFRVAHPGGRAHPSDVLVALGGAPTRTNPKRLCPNPVRRPPQFKLVELFLLVLVAAISCALGTSLGFSIGGLFLVNALALRVAALDFSWRGDVAMIVAIVGGLVCMLLLLRSSLVPVP